MENQIKTTPTSNGWITSLVKAAAWIVFVVIITELLWGLYDPMVDGSAIRQVVVASWILIFLGAAITGLLIHISIQLSAIIDQGNRQHQQAGNTRHNNSESDFEEA